MRAENESSATDRLLQRVTAGENGAVDELLTAYRRYLRLVTDPEPSIRPELETVREYVSDLLQQNPRQ